LVVIPIRGKANNVGIWEMEGRVIVFSLDCKLGEDFKKLVFDELVTTEGYKLFGSLSSLFQKI
jgi:hypothetical protein